MKRMMIALAVVAVFAVAASAAPGDPRFVQGTMEWPATLAGEPFVIVRADDGRVYAVDVAGAVQQDAGGVRAGGRVAFLALEAATPHQLTAIVMGRGDAPALARALSQGLSVKSFPSAAVPLTAPPMVVTVVPPAVAPPAAAAAPVAGGAAATAPAAVVATPAAAAAATAAAPAAVAAPAAGPVAAPAAAHAPAAASVKAAAPAAVTAVVIPPAPPAPAAAAVRAAPFAPIPARESRQWTRLDGRVQSVDGTTLTLQASNGAIVLVDISQLSPNVGQAMRRGGAVTVYGRPLEQRFEAAGYIEVDPGGAEPARTRSRR